MPLSKAEAKINNVKRIVKYGKKDKLQIVDRDSREVLADIKSWSFSRLNPIQKGAPTFSFILAQDETTKELLPHHLVALNGRIHDVIVRNGPISVSDIQWNLRTSPTNSFVID